MFIKFFGTYPKHPKRQVSFALTEEDISNLLKDNNFSPSFVLDGEDYSVEGELTFSIWKVEGPE